MMPGSMRSSILSTTVVVFLAVCDLSAQNPQGALSGQEVVISPGHGYYWHSTLGWTTQRPLIDGLIEDIHTHEIIHDHVLPWLEGSGVRSIMCRARSRTVEEYVIDNDSGAPGYTESGSWSTGSSTGWAGGTYRFANTTVAGGSSANFQATIQTQDRYPVYVAFRAGTNRTNEARIEIDHAGGTSWRTVDQTRYDRRWLYVGTFPFYAGQTAIVRVTTESNSPGVVVADAVKIGDGFGTISRGGSTSGQLRWRECSRYHAQYFGAPSTVWNSSTGANDNSDDVTCRPRYGEWYTDGQGDLYMSLHTNASGCACASGTSTFIHNTTPTAGSALWQQILHTQLISDIQAFWNASWTDRGQQSANFGEVRLLQNMPGCLIELAFHDNVGGDTDVLHHPRFRAVAGRAMYRAIHSYLSPGVPWALDPPAGVALTNDGQGGLMLSWNAVPGASGYRVQLSPDGFAWDDGQVVTGTNFPVVGLSFDQLQFARVACVNAGGTGINSETIGARVAPGSNSPLLMVQGFDRFDRSIKEAHNPKDWLRVNGQMLTAIDAAGYPFDGCTNEAVTLGVVPLPAYRCVGWILGEESTVDETFSSAEQTFVSAYLFSGGRLFFSGAEVGWDLDAFGTASDKNFYENTLGQNYIADDANVYWTQARNTGPLAPLPAMMFDDGNGGIYDVGFPDVIAPTSGSGGQVVLNYITGTGAAVLSGNGRVLGLGFPIEAIVNVTHRNLLMERILELMCPMPVDPVGDAMAGQTLQVDLAFANSPGFIYVAAASAAPAPGIPLGDGRTVPINLDALAQYSLSSQPFFLNMTGNLSVLGTGQLQLQIPNVPGLTGLGFVLSALTIDGVGMIDSVAPWHRVVLP